MLFRQQQTQRPIQVAPYLEHWVDGGLISLWLLDQNDGSWLGLIERTPVILGWGVIIIGAKRYHALLDRNGRAAIKLPDDLFDRMQDDEIEIHIHPALVA